MTDKLLWKAIAAHPGEDAPKLALADWYEERGEARMCLALRYCVARRLWPICGPVRTLWIRQQTRPGRNHLPSPVFDCLPTQRDGIPSASLVFQSWRSAEGAIRALARALERLRSSCEVPQ